MRKRAGLLPFKEFLVTKSMMVRGMAAVCSLAVFSCLPALAQSAVARRVTQKIDETKLTTLTGHIHPAANALNDRGPVDDSAPVGHIVLMLKRSDDQQRSLDAAIDQLHNPNSESFHKWLTPAEFGRRFGPADEDVAAVAGWLESKGFIIEDMPPSKTNITFTGTVGQMRQAFHVNIHHLSVNGEAHEATMNEPRIPSALAPVVSGFRQLHDFRPQPMMHVGDGSRIDPSSGKLTEDAAASINGQVHGDFDTTSGTSPSGTAYEVGPQDFYTIYNEASLLKAGITGAGVTIAVIERTEITNSDVTNFRSLFGLAAYPATPNATQGGINYIYGSASGVGNDTACTAPETGGPSADEGNADIGAEWSGVVAPNAIIDFVACGAASTTIGSDGTDLAASHVVNYLSSSVVAASLAYGECETNAGTTGQTYYTNLWEQYAAEGITAVVSSGETGSNGDPGSLGCDAQNTVGTHNPSVNAKAATAYNVSAGGTDFGDVYITNNYATSPAKTWWNATNGTGESSALSYVPEIAWGGKCSSALYVSYLDAQGTTTYGTTYTPEAICNNTNATSLRTVAGGGGGVSIYNAIPTWQSVYGVGKYSSSTTFRNQPDISMFAASGVWGHLLPYCQADNGTAGACSSATTTAGAGGTSFVAPQLAGLMALIDQKTGDRQGQADYTLYALAAAEYGTISTANTANLASCSGSAQGANVGSTCIFRDIAADTPSLQGGTIASDTIQPCTFGDTTDVDCYRSKSTDTYGLSSAGNDSPTLAYQSGAGYDLTTGLGSVNVANLVNGWSSSGVSFATTTTLQSSAASVPYSTTANLTLTATVTATGRGGAVAPAGTVEFFDGGSITGTLLGHGTIASSCTGTGAATVCTGVATLSLASDVLTPGSNSIVAYFEGDAANDAASTSSSVTVTVTTATQTITFNNAATGTYGGTLTLSATASSGLTPVTFAITGGTGSATLTSGVLTFTGVGTIIVTASQAGNGTYSSATAQQTITVGKAALTINVANASMTYGGTFPAFTDSSITGLVNGDTVGGTITVTYSSTTAATSNAGTYAGAITATVAGTHSGDYTVTVNAGTLTINAAVLTVNVANASMNYGAGFPTFADTSITGLVNGDTVGTTITVTYSSTTPATSNAGTYAGAITATVGGTHSGDYTVTVNAGTLTINAVALTINVANATMNYGAGFPTFTDTSITGLKNGDTVGGTIIVTYSSTTPASSNVGAYAGAITATVSGTSAGNYTVTVNKGTLTIKAVALTVTVNAATMTYGGGFPTFTSTLATLVNGDTVGGTIILTYSSTTAATSNVGNYRNAISVAVSGTSAGNYTVTTTKATLTITQAALAVNVNSASMTYGGGFPTFSGTLVTLVNGDTLGGTITVTYSSTTPANSHPGTYTSAITATVGGSSVGNYAVTINKGTLTITKATPTVSAWPTASAITYGQTLASSTLTGGTGSVAGAFSWTSPSTKPGAGTQTESVTFTPTDTTDYNTVTSTINMTVSPASLSITENSVSGTYGQAPPAFSGIVGGVVNGDAVGTTLTVTYSSTASASSPFSDVGGYPITATVTGPSAGNYTVADSGGTYLITPAALTITVANASDEYGNPLPTFTSTLGGLTNGDTSTDGKHIVHPLAARRRSVKAEFGGVAGDLTVDYSTTASSVTPYSNVGTYPINAILDGAAAGDYTVTTITPGTLTIAPATLAITENPATGVYGSAPPAFTGGVTGAVNGDSVGTTLTVTYSTTAALSSPFSDVGGYPISAVVTGASAGNYTVTDAGSIYTITPAPLTIAVNSVSETWNNPLPTFTSLLTGLLNGDTSSDGKHIVHPLVSRRHANAVAEFGGSANDLLIDYTTNANSSSPYSDVGTYWINASLDSSGAYADYQVTSVTQGVLTINQATQTITFPLIASTSFQYANSTVLLDAVASSGLPVTYYTFTSSVCSLSQSGGVWTLNLLTSGSCSMGANQAGNTDYQEALANGQTFWVYRASQTITSFPLVSLTSYQYALTTVPLTATASSGLPVSFYTLSPSICTVSETGSAWSVSLLTSGNCSLGATQAGNITYNATPFSGQTFWVYQAPQTITSFPLVAASSLQYTNTTVPLTATASSGLPASFISQTPWVCTVSESGTGVWTASLLTSGNCSLAATQVGNNTYSAAPLSGQTFWVYKIAQTITSFPLVALTSFQYANTTVPLTATASSGLPVSFFTQSASVCTVSESGTGTWSVSLLTSGFCSLGAEQLGNSTYNAAPFSGQTFWVYKASQTISFPAVGAQTAGTSVLLPATASSGLAVSYAATTPAVCTIDGTGLYAVLAAPGTCTIQASQAGNATFGAAATVTQSFTVIAPPAS